ncbi:MAG: hypothetical protein JRF40_03430 [Deltaproteobacteria bacterium]|nr:hypothetical protein [Deltaproteobacteria bacterium]MBW2218534.1 hypothetical protein [Deltaproteobacteria bacterium]
MEPIRINIATFEYIDKKLVFIMAVVATALIVISAVNINLFFKYRGRISEYGNKALRIEKVFAEKNMLESRRIEEIGTERSEKILQRAIAANRLIVKDIFPWSRFFEIIETKVPNGIVIHSILPSDDHRSLILEGKATSERKITFFLKRLKEWDFLNNSILTEFSMETNANDRFNKKGSAISFSIKNDLLIENLFKQKQYRETIKSIMVQTEKKK